MGLDKLDPLELELDSNLAASVLLGWKSFHLDNLFMVGLVFKPDLGWTWTGSLKPTLEFSRMVKPLFRQAEVFWCFKILAVLRLGIDRMGMEKGELTLKRMSIILMHIILCKELRKHR